MVYIHILFCSKNVRMIEVVYNNQCLVNKYRSFNSYIANHKIKKFEGIKLPLIKPGFQNKLNDVVLADNRMAKKSEVSEAVQMIEIVKGKSLVEYTGDEDQNFAKITVTLPKFVPSAKRLLTNTIVYQPLATHNFQVFESNVDFETR